MFPESQSSENEGRTHQQSEISRIRLLPIQRQMQTEDSPEIGVKMKNKLRELTCQGNRWSNPERERRLQNYVGGWLNYFRYAHMKSLMRRTDEWLRHRIRAVYWKQWKRVRANYPPIRL